MKKTLLLVFLATVTIARAQSEYEITVESKKPSGIIDEMLYGQLFEHIYFSANNGVWQELIHYLTDAIFLIYIPLSCPCSMI